MPILLTMHLRRLLQYPLAAGLVACFCVIVAAQGPLQSFVLCFGTDGHVAVEASVGLGGSCTDFSVSQRTTPGTPASLAGDPGPGAHCGACRDLVLTHTDALYGSAVSLSEQSSAKTSLGPAVPLVLHTQRNAQPAKRINPRQQPALLSIPLHLSSTLLLV